MSNPASTVITKENKHLITQTTTGEKLGVIVIHDYQDSDFNISAYINADRHWFNKYGVSINETRRMDLTPLMLNPK